MPKQFLVKKSEDKSLDPYLRSMIPADKEALSDFFVNLMRVPLLNDESCARPITELPENASEWLRAEWKKAGTDYPRDPEDKERALFYRRAEPEAGSETDTKVRMLARMVQQLDSHNALNMDKFFRRPTQKLDEVVANVAEAVRRDTGRTPPLDQPRAGSLMEWPHGYHVTELHGVDEIFNARDGLVNQRLEAKDDYDITLAKLDITKKLEEGHKFYCMYGKPDEIHPGGQAAVLETDGRSSLLGCEGRQYQPPSEPAMDYVKQFIIRENLDLSQIRPKWTGLIRVDDNYYNVNRLSEEIPKGTVLPGNQDFSDIKHRVDLPDHVNVEGDLSLRGSYTERFPNNANIRGKLNVSRTRLRSLGNNHEFNGDVDISNSEISGFNEGTQIHGHLNMVGAENIIRLPNHSESQGHHKPRMVVYGDLHLNKTIAGEHLPTLLDDLQSGNVEVKGIIKSPYGKVIEKPSSHTDRLAKGGRLQNPGEIIR